MKIQILEAATLPSLPYEMTRPRTHFSISKMASIPIYILQMCKHQLGILVAKEKTHPGIRIRCYINSSLALWDNSPYKHSDTLYSCDMDFLLISKCNSVNITLFATINIYLTHLVNLSASSRIFYHFIFQIHSSYLLIF